MILLYGEIRHRRIHRVTQELLGKARELGEGTENPQVGVVLLTDRLEENPKTLFDCGADLVYLVEHPRCARFNQEIAAKILSTLIEELAPEIVLAPGTTQGFSVLPAVAVMVETGLVANCTELLWDSQGNLLQTCSGMEGDVLVGPGLFHDHPQMAMVRPKAFPISRKKSRKGRVIRPPLPQECFESAIVPESFDFSQKNGEDIQNIDVVLKEGKELTFTEGFGLLQELENLLEGHGEIHPGKTASAWKALPHQAGIWGEIPSPKLYLGAGISEAIEPSPEVERAKYVVGISKEPGAPFFEMADLAICGEPQAILSELVARIRKERDQ